ncbi:MAG: AMP-binding protein [Actinobacteria bacterium]|nr:AMP-binding protein [Actinomycetota bacterium]
MGLWNHVAETPDKPALRMGTAQRTYGALGDRSLRLATALSDRGVAAGEPVAAMLPNGFEFFEVGCAAAALQARFLPVNWHLKGEELAYIVEDSGAKVLVAHESLGAPVDVALAASPALTVLSVGSPACSYDPAIEESKPWGAGAPWPAPGYMFYTSGTTGRPKGVLHGNVDVERLETMNQGLIGLWGITADDTYLLTGPGYHAGPGGWAFAHLYAGGTVAILPSFDPRAWLGAVDRFGVTTTFMAPAHFIRVLEVDEADRATYDLESLRLVIHAGAPCPESVKRRIMEALEPAEVWELYGMSEGGATRASPAEWVERPGTVGKPWPGVEIKIIGEDGSDLPTGEPGVIYVTPAGGRFEYHNDPEKTGEAWRGDLYTVGDIGYLDDDGYLYLTDRASDMVIRGGVNIYPAEIENVLHDHPAVVDCAVFGVPDERMGERVKAMIECRITVTAEEIQEYVRARLADFKCPEIVEFVDQLPRDPNGKVLKRRLREAHWKDEALNV